MNLGSQAAKNLQLYHGQLLCISFQASTEGERKKIQQEKFMGATGESLLPAAGGGLQTRAPWGCTFPISEVNPSSGPHAPDTTPPQASRPSTPSLFQGFFRTTEAPSVGSACTGQPGIAESLYPRAASNQGEAPVLWRDNP